MKPIRLEIIGRNDVSAALVRATKTRPFNAAISIGSPHPTVVWPKEVLFLDFNDRTPWEGTGLSGLATGQHVVLIIDFARRLQKQDHVLIHCGAGSCRAPAAAIVLLAACGWPSREAVESVFTSKGGQARPNGWVLKLADAILDTDLFRQCCVYERVKWTPPWCAGTEW